MRESEPMHMRPYKPRGDLRAHLPYWALMTTDRVSNSAEPNRQDGGSEHSDDRPSVQGRSGTDTFSANGEPSIPEGVAVSGLVRLGIRPFVALLAALPVPLGVTLLRSLRRAPFFVRQLRLRLARHSGPHRSIARRNRRQLRFRQRARGPSARLQFPFLVRPAHGCDPLLATAGDRCKLVSPDRPIPIPLPTWLLWVGIPARWRIRGHRLGPDFCAPLICSERQVPR